MNKYFLAVDSGGSKTIWSLINSNGEHIREFKTEGLAAVSEGILPVYDTVLNAKKLIDQYGNPERIFLSLGGPNVNEVKDALEKTWNNISVNVEREASGISVLKAAKFLGCSAVVMCGTGSTAVGDTKKGKVYCGGWGPAYADGGSGGGIGSDALKLYLRYIDGIEDIGKLYTLFDNLTDGLDINDFYQRMELKSRALNLNRRYLASLAPEIYSLALNGDKTAKELYDKSALEIALMAKAVSDNDKNVKVLLCGGFFANKPYLLEKCNDYFKGMSNAQLCYNELFSPIISAEIAVLSESNIEITSEIFNNIIQGERIYE